MFRKKEATSTKTVTFNIAPKMTITEMVNAGYRRNEVELLFKELHDKKLGYMIEGKRGGNPMTLFAAPSCPKTYDLSFEVYRLRRSDAEREAIEAKNKDAVTDTITALIASFKELKIGQVPESESDGYVIGFQDNKAVVIKITKGGFHSIEDAVKAAIDQFEKFITFNSKHMNRVEQIASVLRGRGYMSL
jgi:hypothetical protein